MNRIINRTQIVAQKTCLVAEDYSQLVLISRGKVAKVYIFISPHVKNFTWQSSL